MIVNWFCVTEVLHTLEYDRHMLTSLILQSIKKDLRSSSVRILILALLIAVAAVTSVGFFTDRVSRAMQQQASNLLAADMIVLSSAQLPAEIAEFASNSGMRTATTVTFPSVVLSDDDDSHLVAVKAVSNNYPLYGNLQIQSLLAGSEMVEKSPAPEYSKVYVDAALSGALSLKHESVILLGRSEFTVAAIIESEPDRAGDLFQLAPRVMMNLQDLDATELLIEGSRAQYALLLAGTSAQISLFQDWLDQQAYMGLEIRDSSNARPEIKQVLVQIKKFFGLAAMVAVLLSGVAIALSVRQYAYSQAIAGAILRTLGVARKIVLYWILIRLLILSVLALLLGLVLGWFAQQFLVSILGSWFLVDLPAPSWRPVISAVGVMSLCLLGFTSLPLLRAGRVPVVSVLRQQFGGLSLSNRIAAMLAIVAVSLMMYLQSGELLLVFVLLFGLLFMFLVFTIAGSLLYKLMRSLAPRTWPMARFILRRRSDITLLQLSVFGFIIMTMLLISVIRQDIMQAWKSSVADDAPDRFVVNVQPSQLAGVSTFLQQKLAFNGELHPISRGRLISVNGQDAEQKFTGNERAQGYLRHEFNLSFSDSKPTHNDLVEGEWWSPESNESLLSLEKRFAERLSLEVGDLLTFQVAGLERSAKVTNIRSVKWDSFEVNFFVITSRPALQNLPLTYIASFRQGKLPANLTAQLIRENPGITIIEVDKMLQRVRSIIEKASVAVQAVFLFTLVAGIIVLLAAVQGSKSERMRELAVLRAMGASHRQVKQSIILEFTLIGGIAGFLAAIFANIIAWIIGNVVMDISVEVNLSLLIYGAVGGVLLVGCAGYFACRKVLNTPPLLVLQSSMA